MQADTPNAATHSILDDAELAPIRARADRATPGAWATALDNRIEPGIVVVPQRIVWSRESGGDLAYVPSDSVDGGNADAAFIAHAKEDVPRLVAEVIRLRARLEVVETPAA